MEDKKELRIVDSKVHSLSEEQYKSAFNKCGTIRRKLIASITTAKKNRAEK